MSNDIINTINSIDFSEKSLEIIINYFKNNKNWICFEQ